MNNEIKTFDELNAMQKEASGAVFCEKHKTYHQDFCQECLDEKNNMKKQQTTEKSEIEIKNCPPHDFRYSHIEYPPQGTYSYIPLNKEIVICSKCGMIIKTQQI